MTKNVDVQRASRLRAAAHEMLQLADEIEQTYTLRQGKVLTYEYASLTALAARAAAVLASRDRRTASFGKDLLGEPAWDMMLFLFVARAEKKRVKKTAVTAASGVSQATALRYLGVMAEQDLVVIERSASDQRIQFVSLTSNGMMRMSSCLARTLRLERGLEEFSPTPSAFQGKNEEKSEVARSN